MIDSLALNVGSLHEIFKVAVCDVYLEGVSYCVVYLLYLLRSRVPLTTSKHRIDMTRSVLRDCLFKLLPSNGGGKMLRVYPLLDSFLHHHAPHIPKEHIDVKLIRIHLIHLAHPSKTWIVTHSH